MSSAPDAAGMKSPIHRALSIALGFDLATDLQEPYISSIMYIMKL
jgi:hypothetical protein